MIELGQHRRGGGIGRDRPCHLSGVRSTEWLKPHGVNRPGEVRSRFKATSHTRYLLADVVTSEHSLHLSFDGAVSAKRMQESHCLAAGVA
jgi:hypothetical protein